jgi:hypothetical protein
MNRVLLLILISYSFIYSQGYWFPDKMNIQPFTANFLEPKAGFHFSVGKSDIRLDIGTSADFYRYEYNSSVFSFGGDLFTYTRLRGTEEFHFPVEAIDYLFGLNAGYKIYYNKTDEYGLRFRFSHISAHFVDGHFDYDTRYWRNNLTPRVYSREFLEFFPYLRFEGLRLYAGYTFLINVTPEYLGKSIIQSGFDYFFNNEFLPFIPFAAYDIKLQKLNAYMANHILSAGIKFGQYNRKGFSILASYFSGKSIHGEYFDFTETYTTIGFNLDI